MKPLLVEDSDDIRDAFTGLLRAEGAYVIAVATGSWARQAGADLVLTKPVEWPDLLAHLRQPGRPVAAQRFEAPIVLRGRALSPAR